MQAILVVAGVACMLGSVVHGYLGQTKLIGPVAFERSQAKAMVVWIWQFSSVAWAACGAVIAASPWLFHDRDRPIAVALACLPLLWGIVGNAWITRGQHFGWKLYAIIVALALVGVLA